ncbi:MAG: YHS domain-containing protein [Planctomycetes bacterium]|nr:YHS domain-containing protein [Planctomycetota bacterium]MBU1518250.1 YHS domain-containing protein [Planctomycetota bacterium]MBU2458357.1 YHS domain-containing protein [Planctomycetota bacterium]MBU2596639.1 YHS domain-containing protein [Planctomycetota bacterium]
MNSKKALTLLIAICLLVIAGCQKKTEPAAPAAEANAAVSAAVEQTMCPVMGGVINKDLFVEYQGKKVYFCCGQCKGDFEKDPEKYIAKLPQFKN